MPAKIEATIDDLYHVPEDGKAELVNGELRLMSPTGDLPGSAAAAILVSLYAHMRRTGVGRAYGDNVGFIVNLPNRKSFSPDAAYYTGPRTRGKFLEGAPVFAVEVRSEGDYGPHAEKEMAEKRRDYFAAGTLVVWDVDVLQTEVVRVYGASDPENPRIYRRGELAEAEPAVPGWAMPVEDLFN
jgi:Uma2 family endonuclease